MVPAYEFGSKELVRDLRRMGAQLAKQYFGEAWTLASVIMRAINGYTFRRFGGLNVPPSRIFRSWARAYFTAARWDELSTVRARKQFDAFLEEAFASLAKTWLRRGGKALDYGPGMKLLSLLLKAALRMPRFTRADRDRLILLLHVPLDKFTLAAIRQFSQSGRFGPPTRIRRGAGMGIVLTREQYGALQQIMRGVAKAARVPAICIDLLAWDLAHT